MRRKLIEISRELLVIFMNHWVLAMAAMTVVGLFHKEKPYIWLWIGLMVVPMLFYWIREKVGNFFLFFLAHFAVLVVGVISPIELLPKIFMLLVIGVYIGWSVKIRVIQEMKVVEQLHPIFVLIAITALSIVFDHFSDLEWRSYYITAVLLYLTAYLVRYYLLDYEQFLLFNATSASNLPAKSIFWSGFKQTLLYTVGCIGMLFLIANFRWLASVGQWLKAALFAVLRVILSLLPQGTGVPEGEPAKPDRPPSSGSITDMLPPGEAGKFWLILEDIMMAALVIVFIVAVVWGLVKGARYLWKHFHEEPEVYTRDVDLGMDIRERCEIDHTKSGIERFFAFRDNREKVRKIYRNKVSKGKSAIIGTAPVKELEYYTARECCKLLKEQSLRTAYEKARYSELEITSEDVKLAKSR